MPEALSNGQTETLFNGGINSELRPGIKLIETLIIGISNPCHGKSKGDHTLHQRSDRRVIRPSNDSQIHSLFIECQ